jgi:hypothetical protein
VTHIKFIDYTPDGATSSIQAGCVLKVVGNLYIGDSTKLWLRADIGNSTYDSITTDPNQSYDVELNGDSLQLDLNIRNPGLATSFAMDRLIAAGGSLTSPDTPFGGGATLSGAWTGWSWDANSPSKDSSSVNGAIHS